MLTEPEHQHVLDAQNLLCPEPVMMLHNAIRDAASDEVIKVIATDPSTERDVPKFCEFLGHELVARQSADGLYYYWIRKS